MSWLSKITPKSPSPGLSPPGVNTDALKAYRDLAIKVIQNGTDGVGTQRLRVQAIDKALGQ